MSLTGKHGRQSTSILTDAMRDRGVDSDPVLESTRVHSEALLNQGINPERWHLAVVAPVYAQEQFARQKNINSTNHFKVGNLVYARGNDLRATPAQIEYIVKGYLQQPRARLEDVVNPNRVALPTNDDQSGLGTYPANDNRKRTIQIATSSDYCRKMEEKCHIKCEGIFSLPWNARDLGGNDYMNCRSDCMRDAGC